MFTSQLIRLSWPTSTPKLLPADDADGDKCVPSYFAVFDNINFRLPSQKVITTFVFVTIIQILVCFAQKSILEKWNLAVNFEFNCQEASFITL